LRKAEAPELSLRRKTELLRVTRSKLYYQPKPRLNEDKIIDKILDIYEAHPIYGYHRMTASLRRQGVIINHKKVRKIMIMLISKGFGEQRNMNG
jgi:hypothetical protein